MSLVERTVSPVAEARHQLQQLEGQFKAALPAHIPVERFARVVMTAIQNNPKLVTKCTRQSLWNACMKSAQDGLLPDSREAAIVEYGDQATYMPMIAGLRKKVRNSDEIATWDVYVVHANDKFDFRLGDDPFIAHVPTLASPGPVIAAYSIAVLKSGEKTREVMSIDAIEKVRARSKAKNNGPWVTDYEEMCRKTVARRHFKVLPASTDLDDLMRRDDDLYDLNAAKDEAQGNRPKSLAGRLDALAAMADKPGETVDAETGEVTEAAPTNGTAVQPQTTAAAPTTQPSTDQQATEAIVDRTETEGEIDLATEEFPDETEHPPREPDDEESYRIYAEWNIEHERNPENLKAWFIGDAQKHLRHDCKVGKATFDALQAKAKARIAQLINQQKAA